MIAIALYLLYGFIAGLIIGGAFHPAISSERMERIFEEDYDLLVIVRNYLENSTHESVYIHNSMEHGEISIRGRRVEIEDVEVVEAISTLWSRGYRVIGKRGNTVHFQRWSNRHNGRGIVYSIDGTEPTDADLQYLTRAEPLSVLGWYYYEEDVREWRRSQE